MHTPSNPANRPTKFGPKMYSVQAVLVATVLGGPMAAAYLIAEKYKVVGEYTKVTPTWLYAIGGLEGLLMLGVIIPEEIMHKIPGVVFTMLSAWVA